MRMAIVFLLVFLPFVISAKDRIPKTIYEFKVKDRFGKTIDFAKFKGKKILIVNAPAMNINSAQYAELEALYQKHKDNLVIVGFLMEDFAKLPGGKIDLDNLDKRNYNVSFPLSGLAEVKGDGDNLNPVYKWLTHAKYNHFRDSDVQWDFQKYLINEKGELVGVFHSTISVTNPEFVEVFEK